MDLIYSDLDFIKNETPNFSNNFLTIPTARHSAIRASLA